MPTVPLDLDPETHERYASMNRIKDFRVRHMDIYLAGLSSYEQAAKRFVEEQERKKEATQTL